jgi:hypothetical protein
MQSSCRFAIQLKGEDAQVTEMHRHRNLIVGLAFVLGPVAVYFLLFFLAFTQITRTTSSLFVIFFVLAEALGLGTLLRGIRKRVDLISVASILTSALALFLLGVAIWRIK